MIDIKIETGKLFNYFSQTLLGKRVISMPAGRASIISSWNVVNLVGHASPQIPIIGIARTILAMGTLATFLFTPRETLFFRSESVPSGTLCQGISEHASLYCIAPVYSSNIAYVVTLGGLILVVVGIIPGVTVWLHAWIAWSFQASSPVPDGGDQLASTVSILLIIVFFLDMRKWHWTAGPVGGRIEVLTVIRYAGITLLIVQMAVVYLHACIGKLGVEEWQNGTNVWYWINESAFSPPGVLKELLLWISSSWVGSAFLTYGTLALEALLAISVLLPRRFAAVVILIGLVFHFAIAVVFGLWSFLCSMIALLVLGFVVPLFIVNGLEDCDCDR